LGCGHAAPASAGCTLAAEAETPAAETSGWPATSLEAMPDLNAGGVDLALDLDLDLGGGAGSGLT
jgi:hypothetical protein